MATRVYHTPAPRPNRGASFEAALNAMNDDERYAAIALAVLAPLLPAKLRRKSRQRGDRAALAVARVKLKMREMGLQPPDVKKPA
jgi:hypothetical protein